MIGAQCKVHFDKIYNVIKCGDDVTTVAHLHQVAVRPTATRARSPTLGAPRLQLVLKKRELLGNEAGRRASARVPSASA